MSTPDLKPAPKGRIYPTPDPTGVSNGSFDFGSLVVGITRDGMCLTTQDGRIWRGVDLEDGSLAYDPVNN